MPLLLYRCIIGLEGCIVSSFFLAPWHLSNTVNAEYFSDEWEKTLSSYKFDEHSGTF